MIKVRGLMKRYGEVVALRNIDFDFQDGVCGIVGPNGAGKSTLIKILTGLLKPDAGSVEIDGLEPFHQRSQTLRGIGIMHQRDVFPSWATARQYLRFAASVKGIKELDSAIREASELAGIASTMDRTISAFSGGMTRRLALAVALLGLPKLILMDEPTANLDPPSRAKFLEDVSELREQKGISFLISTHLLPDLEKVCTSLLILNEGVMLGYGRLGDFSPWPGRSVFEVTGDNLAAFPGQAAWKGSVISMERSSQGIRFVVTDEATFLAELNMLSKALSISLYSLRRLEVSIEQIFQEAMRNAHRS